MVRALRAGTSAHLVRGLVKIGAVDALLGGMGRLGRLGVPEKAQCAARPGRRARLGLGARRCRMPLRVSRALAG